MPREVVHNESGEVSRGLGVTGEAILPSEVLQRHGVGGNAEVLIAAVREHYPAELDAAIRKRPNFELDKQLRAGKLEYPSGSKMSGTVDVSKIAGEGAVVHDARVRGVDSVVYTAADSQGTLYKGTFRLSDPDGTHVSQAELLRQEGSVAAPIVNGRRAGLDAAASDIAARQAELDAREKALAKREQELDKAAQEQRSAKADVGNQQGTGGDPDPNAEKPRTSTSSSVLPPNYDELNVEDAAKVVEALEGDAKAEAIAYERAHKGRKRITGD